jgi:hypothetical protein
MIFAWPHSLPRLAGQIADASDSDGSPELVVKLSIKKADGSQPSTDEISEIRHILAAYGSDGPIDSRIQNHFTLPKKSK